MLCQKKRNETLPGSKPSSDSPTEMRTPVGRKNDRRLQAGKQASENGTGTSAKYSLTHRKEGKASVKYMVIYRHRETYSISEGKLIDLPLNRPLFDEEGNLYDIIAGTSFVVGLLEDDFASLSPELIQKYSDRFKTVYLF